VNSPPLPLNSTPLKVKKGALYQPEALDVSKELQQQGYDSEFTPSTPEFNPGAAAARERYLPTYYTMSKSDDMLYVVCRCVIHTTYDTHTHNI
jgi:hypothetical protein